MHKGSVKLMPSNATELFVRGPYIFNTSARSWTLSSVNIHSVLKKNYIIATCKR